MCVDMRHIGSSQNAPYGGFDVIAQIWVELRHMAATRSGQGGAENGNYAAGAFAIASSRATQASIAHLTRAM
jgi:hypothetical protein